MSKSSKYTQNRKATENRKREHIDTVLNSDVSAKGVKPGFERFFFEHVALPELSLDDIDLSTELFGKTLKAPLLISSMTGGTDKARNINLHLAEAAQALGVAMGLGSQRAAIERDELAFTYRVRQVAPGILLFANVGAVQLNYGYGPDEYQRAVDMIEADALFIHLNPLQEAVQKEGDRNWRHLLKKLKVLIGKIQVPVVVKEVGNGISASIARQLLDCGVAGIDVAGAGGTSWSEVEASRQLDPFISNVAHSFAGWGIPTALALREVRNVDPNLVVFASGGLRNGLDVAKAIRLGADLCGMAIPMLESANATANAVHDTMSQIIEELRISAFCTGSKNLSVLRHSTLRRAGDWSVIN